MSRSYKRVRPRKHFVYSVDDLMKLYAVTRNTVSNWVKEGLRPSDGSVPYVFGGEEVQRFHDARQLTSSAPLRKGEFKCLGCRGRVFPEPQGLSLARTASGGGSVMGRCPDCDRVVTKRVDAPERTLKERRDRAMVAIAFLGALRADTISSLRVGHLRRSEGLIIQDASRSRTKNGKSLRVKFFPLPAIFLETTAAWKQELLDLGFKTTTPSSRTKSTSSSKPVHLQAGPFRSCRRHMPSPRPSRSHRSISAKASRLILPSTASASLGGKSATRPNSTRRGP